MTKPNEKSDRKWIIFTIASIGTFMAALDSSIVNISMPTITQYFQSDIATTNWVVSIYLLTLSSLLLVFGKLSDMISRKTIFTAGIAIFTLSSLACGLSGTLMELIVSRFFKAIGGAMIMANSPAIITEAFPPQERGKALGTIGTVVGMGIMIGSPLGGEIVSALSWRYIFFINIPVGIIGTVLSIIILKGRQNDVKNSEPFDFLGALLLMIFLITFLLGMSIGSRNGFGENKVLILFAVSVIFFVAFLLTELKVRNPTVELHLFQNMGFSSTNLAALASYSTIFMVMFMMPFFLKRVTGLAPGLIGRIMIAPTIMMLVFSPIFGWVSDKIGYRLLRCSGLTLMAIALFFLSHIDKTTQISMIVSMLFLFGFGIGMFTPPNNSLLMGSVPKDKLGVGAGMLAATRNIGMMMGVAAASAIFTYQVKHYSVSQTMDAAAVIKSHMAYSDVFFIAAFVSILGVVVAFFQDKFIS